MIVVIVFCPIKLIIYRQWMTHTYRLITHRAYVTLRNKLGGCCEIEEIDGYIGGHYSDCSCAICDMRPYAICIKLFASVLLGTIFSSDNKVSFAPKSVMM